MNVSECNPFVRAAEIQPAVLEGVSPRLAYDHRIFLILDGEGIIYIAGREYLLKKRALVFIPPETEYFFRGKMKVVVLNFDVTRAYQNQRKPLIPVPHDLYDPARRFDLTTVDGLAAPAVLDADPSEEDCVTAIASAFVAKTHASDARTSAELKKLLAELLEHLSDTGAPVSHLAERLLLYIRSNAAELHSNEELARVFGYHPIYVAAVVKNATGKSLHRVILEERIRLAKKFLRSTANSVEEIAFDTGFSSRNHFCTVFRQITGVTPLAYRTGK